MLQKRVSPESQEIRQHIPPPGNAHNIDPQSSSLAVEATSPRRTNDVIWRSLDITLVIRRKVGEKRTSEDIAMGVAIQGSRFDIPRTLKLANL